MQRNEIEKNLNKINKLLEDTFDEHILLATFCDPDGYLVPVYRVNTSYEAQIAHIAKLLMICAQKTDTPMEEIGEDLNNAVKAWLEREAQENENNE